MHTVNALVCIGLYLQPIYFRLSTCTCFIFVAFKYFFYSSKQILANIAYHSNGVIDLGYVIITLITFI